MYGLSAAIVVESFLFSISINLDLRDNRTKQNQTTDFWKGMKAESSVIVWLLSFYHDTAVNQIFKSREVAA